MTTISETEMTSSELGAMWMAYEIKALMDKMIGCFTSKTQDSKAKKLLEYHFKENKKQLDEIKVIFTKGKVVIPIAFGDYDVFNDAPALFDDIYHIMFLRSMMKVKLGFSAIHLGMTYRNDIRKVFENIMIDSKDTYGLCTDYLTKQGVLSKPPYVTMPKEIEFIEETKYMSGIQMFGNKRALNTLEVAYIFQTLELNVFAMQLMTGFAQVAKENEIKNYFVKGKELAKKIISDFSSVLLESDIQPPTTWAGKATDSIIPPFSDKLMMYVANILASSALANNAIGMAFSIRSDLPLKLAVISKDTMDIAREGGKLMIKHKWLEEPPQMEDRNRLIKAKKSLLPV